MTIARSLIAARNGAHAPPSPCPAAWDGQASFDRFIRTWIGVWMVNGMGLPRDAFAAPIQTDIGEQESAPGAGEHAA